MTLTETAPWCGRTPRRWQPEAIDAVLQAFRRGVKRPLVQACTGAGKSIWLAELAALCKGRVLVTTPSQQLVQQLHRTLSDRLPGEVGLAYQHGWDVEHRVVVTCNASLSELLDENPRWDCWIADEAHRMEGEGLRTQRDRIQRKVACGLTATPFRADKRGVDWDELVYSYPSGQAVEDGVLVPWRAVRWDGTGKPTVDELVDGWVREAEGPGVVSATSISDAEETAKRLGVLAIHSGISARERHRRLQMLERGEIPCLVHVSMLVEGIDLPWLRWLALRRPVGSPVRLVQEIGRVLRAHPGKTEAVLYDPYNLIGALGLTHEAQLEDALATEEAQAEQEEWHIPELDGLDGVSRLPPPVAVETLSGWVLDVLEALRSYGLAQPAEYGLGPWRQEKVSEKQRDSLQRMTATWARYFPYEPHRRAARWLSRRPDLRRGPASDMISVLSAFANQVNEARVNRRGWKCPVALPNIAVPTEEAL